jgi:hypothetical protein
MLLFQIIISSYVMLNKEKLRSELNALYNKLFNNIPNYGTFMKFLHASEVTDTVSEVMKLLEIVLFTTVSTAESE